MYVDAEHVRTLALQQTRDELASPASPPPVVSQNAKPIGISTVAQAVPNGT